MFHLLHRVLSSRSAFVTNRVARGALQAVTRAPAFVHIGLASGAAAVVLTVLLLPSGRFALGEPSLSSLSLWGLLAAAMAGALATLVYACYGRRCDTGGTRAPAAIVRRAGRSAIVRFVAMQFVVIAALLLFAFGAVALFRNTASGVFLAALSTGCAGVLGMALRFLDRSRFATLVDLADGLPVAAGWPAARVAHVHRQRVKAALAWDAATARREQQPSLASRLVPAGHAGPGGEARNRRVSLPDLRFSLRRAVNGEARLRLRGLLPIVALAVPYGAAAAVAAAILAPPPSGPLPTAPDVVAARSGGRPQPQNGDLGGSRGGGGGNTASTTTGGEAGAAGRGRPGAGDSAAADNPLASGQGADGSRRPGSSAGGDPAGTGHSTADAAEPATNRSSASAKAAAGSNRSAAAAGDQHAVGRSRGVPGGDGEQGAGRTTAAAAGAGIPPATGSAAAAEGAGPGRGPRSAAKPFVEGRQGDGRNDIGREIMVTGIEPGTAAGTSGPPVPDSALSRGVRLTPAPLIDWPSPPVSSHGGAGTPRPYRPRQALPAWTAPLIPGAVPGRP